MILHSLYQTGLVVFGWVCVTGLAATIVLAVVINLRDPKED